jgi:hypothetical protein
MIKAIILSLALWINPSPYFYIEPELEELVLEVIAELEEEGVWPGYDERFLIRASDGVPKQQRVIGVAYGYQIDNHTNIVIFRKRFDNLGRYQKKHVILHEIGHDVYNLRHGEIVAMLEEVPEYVPYSYYRYTLRQFIKHIKKENRK